MYKYLFSLLLFSFCSIHCFSQEEYSIEWFSADSKQLPQNSVKSIVQDKYGFIWMTTENGLVRFDGTLFQTYDLIPKNIENRMYSIQGNVSSDSLFTFIDNDNFYVLINKRKPSLIKLKKNSNEWKKMKLQKNANMNRTSLANRNDLGLFKQYLYTSDNSLFEINKDEIKLYNQNKQLKFTKKGQFNILNFCLINDHLIYIDTDLTTTLINKYGKTFTSQPLTKEPKHPHTVYTNHAAQQVFIKINKTLYLLTEENNVVASRKIYASESLDDILLRTVYFDTKNEVLYLGSLTDGLCVVKKKQFKTIRKDQTKTEFFYAIDTLSESTIITSKGSVMDQNKVIDDIPFLTKGTSFFNLIVDKNHRIWFTDGEKICCIKNIHDTKLTDSILFKNQVTKLFKGENNIIWFSTNTDKENNKIFGYFDPNEPKKSIKKYKFIKPINVLLQNNNTLWIGTVEGVYNYNLVTKKTIKLKDQHLINPRSISKTQDNNIWVTTYGNGLYLVRDNTLLRVPSDSEGILDHSHCIIEDDEHSLWISTNEGLFAINRENIYDYFDKKTNNIHYRYFDKSNGFLTNEFNGGCSPCGIKTAGGTIAFPSMNGVVFFNPKKLNYSKSEYQFYIDKAIVDNKPIIVKDTIVLDRNFSRLNITVENPYFDFTTINPLEAQLNSSANKEWLPLDNQNTITFTTLPNGTHNLIFRKFSKLNNKYEFKTITIIVPPAFWQTWWFKLILALLTFILISYSIKLRTDYIQNQNKQLESKVNERTLQLDQMVQTLLETKNELKTRNESQKKIIGTITHDFRSPLRFLALVSKNLFENKSIQPEEMQENLMTIHTSSNQLYQFISNLVDYSKALSNDHSIENEPFNLYSLVNEKIDLFKNIAWQQKTTIHTSVSESIFINSNKLLVSIIVHNLLDNAVKNTYEGSISLTWTNNNLEIADTGVGMDEKTVAYYNSILLEENQQQNLNSSGLGIKIVLNLVRIINAKIEFSSVLNQGTLVKIQFRDDKKALFS